MFSEILKIIPKVENLNGLERTLNSRFARIAKKFGGGLISAIKGGGVVGLAVGLIDRVLNPLQQVQEAIEKSLNQSDDLATFAKQFKTSAGNLARLQAFGAASGLDPEGVRLLLGKFQAAVAQSAAEPGKPSSVSNFVGRTDTAEAFFEFVQSVQKLTATQQSLVQQEVFGEKQILKASEFLNADFKDLSNKLQAIGTPSTQQVTAAAEFQAQLKDNKDLLTAARGLRDIVAKGRLINDGTVAGLDAKEQLDLNQENKQLGSFKSLQQISIENQKLFNLAVNQFLKLAPLLAQVLPAVTAQLTGVEKSRLVRGMIPGAGKDK